MNTNIQISEDRNTESRKGKKYVFWKNTTVVQIITLVFLALAIWAIAISLFGVENAGPNSQIFQLAVLFISGKVLGVIVGYARIPPMLGMLAMGVLLRNVGFLNLTGSYVKFAAILR